MRQLHCTEEQQVRNVAYLGHLLTVSLGVEGSLGQEDGVLLGGNTQLIVESVMPDLQTRNEHGNRKS